MRASNQPETTSTSRRRGRPPGRAGGWLGGRQRQASWDGGQGARHMANSDRTAGLGAKGSAACGSGRARPSSRPKNLDLLPRPPAHQGAPAPRMRPSFRLLAAHPPTHLGIGDSVRVGTGPGAAFVRAQRRRCSRRATSCWASARARPSVRPCGGGFCAKGLRSRVARAARRERVGGRVAFAGSFLRFRAPLLFVVR